MILDKHALLDEGKIEELVDSLGSIDSSDCQRFVHNAAI